MVLTGSFVLSPVTGLFLSLSPAEDFFRWLDASVGASGPHDFTVRVGALVRSTSRVHRIPHPTSVTIAKRPSFERRMAEDVEVIWVKREAENFFGEDWTGEISLKLKENFFST